METKSIARIAAGIAIGIIWIIVASMPDYTLLWNL